MATMNTGLSMIQDDGTSLPSLIDAYEITSMHDAATREWHTLAPSKLSTLAETEEIEQIIKNQHLANFELWHLEDEARSPYSLDREIASVKRQIDQVNQARNDLIERLDAILLATLSTHGMPAPVAPLHSETPGLIVDRLSILSLKIFHSREEAERKDASPGHVRRNRERLQVLEDQRNDLAQCLDRLWEQVIHGQRRFKLYRQFKMYNDPTLNPVLYRKPKA
ncbi:MAG TPA: DUF4254 domain-containing protein [Acidobacteriaceae bacterium]|nr:DUF4254 domain-containing protein [Acidobacteriaceae bacterium]